MKRALQALIPATAILFLTGGCPMMTPNDNSNSNANSNSNSNGNSNGNVNDNSNTITLTASQKAEVDISASSLTEAAEVFSLYAGLANASLDFASLGAIGSFGTCPTISYVSDANSAGFSIDFGMGCESAALGDATVSGSTGFTYMRATRAAMFTYDNLTIETKSVNGSATATVRGNSNTGVTIDGRFDILVGGKMISGEIVLLIALDGSVTINADALSFVENGETVTLAINDVVINGVTNESLLPESGSITYTDGDNRPVTVTFSQQTVQNGTVDVSVGNLGSATYQLAS